MEKNKAEYEIYKLHRQAGKENEAKLLQRGMQHSIYLVARQGFLVLGRGEESYYSLLEKLLSSCTQIGSYRNLNKQQIFKYRNSTITVLFSVTKLGKGTLLR